MLHSDGSPREFFFCALDIGQFKAIWKLLGVTYYASLIPASECTADRAAGILWQL